LYFSSSSRLTSERIGSFAVSAGVPPEPDCPNAGVPTTVRRDQAAMVAVREEFARMKILLGNGE
jgi:hypothetical protein